MIPGPVEVSPRVRESLATAPPSHLAPGFIESFGASLEMMREVWMAEASAQPMIVSGGGTVGMEIAAANIVEPGNRVVQISSGYFSARSSEMLRRLGAEVHEIGAPVGEAPDVRLVERALDDLEREGPVKALFATHVDTSTGVLVDPAPLARLARQRGLLSVFDGVCATGAERFEMGPWGADVYLTASQKAIGLPAGLALMVVSERAITARSERRATPPPMYLDWEQWGPVMRAYEERRPAYFSTPATTLVVALEVGLKEILAGGEMEARFAMHRRAALAMRAAWRALGLEVVPVREEEAAHTLSAIYYPGELDAALIPRIVARGVVVAGGLHPEIRAKYFRVGHMGYAASRPEMLLLTVTAVAGALADSGARVDPAAAVRAAENVLNG
jgi:alanine-glyoxylate transaminase/serine-glyoxylate transaminase/serine-pyruvate transaminase